MMAEPTQKQMLLKLLADVKTIKEKQGKMALSQNTMKTKLDHIEIELSGTCIEPGRGVVPRLVKVEGCIDDIKKKQYKIYTWALVIAVGINVLWAGVKTIIALTKG